MGLVGSKDGTSCTRSDSIFLDKLVRYDLLMTSFIACISGWLRRGRGLGSPQDRGDGLQHACHQVLRHQLQQVTRCHGVIALSWVVNNLILTIPPQKKQITTNSTGYQNYKPKLLTNPTGLGELRALAHLRSTAGPDLTSRCSTQLASRRSR